MRKLSLLAAAGALAVGAALPVSGIAQEREYRFVTVSHIACTAALSDKG